MCIIISLPEELFTRVGRLAAVGFTAEGLVGVWIGTRMVKIN